MSSRDTLTAANKNRKIRQDALREQLSQKGLIQHVLEISDKLADVSIELPSDIVARYKIVIDTNLKLITKYLPDLKSTEITGDPDQPLTMRTLTDAELERIAAGSE